MAYQVPSTGDGAIAELVEQDVARWGEKERAASEAQHAGQSYGMALNALYARAELAGRTSEAAALLAASRKALSAADRRTINSAARDD